MSGLENTMSKVDAKGAEEKATARSTATPDESTDGYLQWIVENHSKRRMGRKRRSAVMAEELSNTVGAHAKQSKTDSDDLESMDSGLQISDAQRDAAQIKALKLAVAKAEIARMWAEKAAAAQTTAAAAAERAGIDSVPIPQTPETTVAFRTSVPKTREQSSANRRQASTGNSTNGPAKEYPKKELQLIPLRKMHEAQLITPAAPRSQVAEEYRAIKRPILNYIDRDSRSEDQNSNIVMVTSCLAGEGKTYSAVNLAMSIAMERDRTVLLVDADIMKASAGKLLELDDNSYGLIDLIIDKDPNLDRAVLDTDVENLQVMTTGIAHQNSSEILASSQMANLVDTLSRQNPDRVVIFDAPPVLLTSEAVALASQVGQIVFVVSAVSTPQSMVSHALESLDTEARIGLMLNKSPTAATTGLYGYGYGVRTPVATRTNKA